LDQRFFGSELFGQRTGTSSSLQLQTTVQHWLLQTSGRWVFDFVNNRHSSLLNISEFGAPSILLI
jgi:hypothetical protein